MTSNPEQEVKPADLPEDLGGYDIDDEYEPEDEDPGDECGRWDNGRLEVQGAVLLQLVEAVKGLAPKQEPAHTPTVAVKPTHEVVKLKRDWFVTHKVPVPNPGDRMLGKLVTHVDLHMPTQEYWIQVQA